MSESKAQSLLPSVPPVVPHLVVAQAADAIAFYQRAFGAELRDKIITPQGKYIHVDLRLPNGGVIFLFEEALDWGLKGPRALGGSAVTVHLEVPDVDASWKQALAAGAEVAHELQDTFWGARYGQLRDPFGHSWSLATKKRDVTLAERDAAAATVFSEQK